MLTLGQAGDGRIGCVDKYITVMKFSAHPAQAAAMCATIPCRRLSRH
jgi:hypothetical protein